MRKLTVSCALQLLLASLSTLAIAQKKPAPSDAQYTAMAVAAAPKEVAKDATVVRMDDSGKMTTIRQGNNGFTCMVIVNETMCADANSLAFFEAVSKHQTPSDKLGLTYMMEGDQGASNTDPWATAKSADNHWVVTGPHIMIVGAGSKTLGLPATADADTSRPYMMWPGTPYEHAMIPVGTPKPAAKTAAKADAMKK